VWDLGTEDPNGVLQGLSPVGHKLEYSADSVGPTLKIRPLLSISYSKYDIVVCRFT